MSFFIVSGSHRKNSESERVAKFVEARLKSLFPKDTSEIFSLAGNPLPFWDEELWENAPSKWDQIWTPVKQKIEASQALVLITPEWGGMASPGIKNFLLLCAGNIMAHKPVYLIAVSAARGGSYPISELRMISHKNNHACFLPEHLILRNVGELFGQAVSGEDDAYLRGRLDYGLKMLHAYAKALTEVRNSGIIDLKNYPNGM